MGTNASGTRSERGGGTDVLVIEDDSLLESLLVTGFENRGVEVDSIEYGYDCHAAIDRLGRPRVVVVDAVLPCTDGVELGVTLDERYADVTVFVVNTGRQSSHVDLDDADVETRPTVDPVALVDAISDNL